VIVASVWGVFRDGSRCGLEIGCYPGVFDPLGGGVREPAFSLVRVVGIASGLAALVWGSLEAKLDPRRVVGELMQAAVVFLVLVILFAPGYSGLGRLQATAFVIVLVLAVPVVVFREVLAEWLGAQLRFRYVLVAAMALSVILGAWTFVLASVSPFGCRGVGVVGRCAAELRSATLLAVAAAATGLSLVYARWEAIRDDRGMVRRAGD
jgi:hypothetical protein